MLCVFVYATTGEINQTVPTFGHKTRHTPTDTHIGNRREQHARVYTSRTNSERDPCIHVAAEDRSFRKAANK